MEGKFIVRQVDLAEGQPTGRGRKQPAGGNGSYFTGRTPKADFVLEMAQIKAGIWR